MPPTEWEETTVLALLESSRERRDGNTNTHNFLVGIPVLYQGDEIKVGHRQIHLHIMVDLLLTQLRISVEILECVIDDREYLLSISFLEHLVASKLLDMEIISLLYHTGNLGIFLWHLIRHIHLVFHIIVVLLPTSKLLHVLGIVGIIIYGGLSAKLVESPCKHTLGVHIRESKRPYSLLHTVLPTPILYSGKKGTRHFDVVDEIYPSEAHSTLSPALVGFLVYNSSHTACYLTILIGKEILGFAELKSGILILRQCINLIAMQIGHIVLIAAIKVIMELYERL